MAILPTFRAAALAAALVGLGGGAHALELTPPAGWTAPARAIPGVLLTYTESAAEPAGPGTFVNNVVALRGKLPPAGRDSLPALMARNQARRFPQYRILEQSPRDIAGRPGFLLVSSYAQGDLDLACAQYVFAQGKEFITVIFTCPLAELARMRPQFERCVRSLKPDPA